MKYNKKKSNINTDGGKSAECYAVCVCCWKWQSGRLFDVLGIEKDSLEDYSEEDAF